ncbi:MAG: alpha/beta hydrolase [Rhizobiaceae bacterium]|nr:alpha/beta hydrolase [Rhizobiaceae bacterium]
MSTLFFETPANPVPENARAGFFVTADGKTLRYARFPATGRPLKGTVIIIQGRNECIEKYFETARDITARGLGVATFDLRGQGASDRLISDPERGYVESFDEYVSDVERFFEEVVLADCRAPFYIMGHSTGALVGLLAAPRMINRVQRMILCVPLLGLKGLPFSNATVRRATALLYNVGLGHMYLTGGPRPKQPTPFATNVLTTDLGRYLRNVQIFQTWPQLGLGGPTATWIHAATVAVDKVHDPEFMARIQIPMLFIAAGSDEVVSTEAIEHYAKHLRAGSLLTLDGARHEVWQEADIFREQLLAAFDAFIPGTDPRTI